MINFQPIFNVAIVLAFFLPLTTQASIVSLANIPNEIRPGDSFLVDVMLDAEGKAVNAVQGMLVFPPSLVSVKTIYERDTVVGAWIESPALRESGTISWSGIMPGGFAGVLGPAHTGAAPGRLFTVQFEVRERGTAAFIFENVEVLLNDGKGTADVVTAADASVEVRADAPARAEPYLTDRNPPETFTPVLAQNEEVEDGKWFVAFVTHDKGTGVSHYTVYESRNARTAIGEDEWKDAVSPYVLRDQSRRSYVYVRAVDSAGNERVVELAPMRRAYGWADAALGLVILIVFVWVLSRWKQKRS